MVYFLTLPPDRVPYGYVLISARDPHRGIQYLKAHRERVEMVIIDSGVEIFRSPKVTEYPGGPDHWVAHIRSVFREVKRIVPSAAVYATCPDYPDDYNPGSLWLSSEVTNIERSVDNLERCFSYSDVKWLIPIQGHYRKPETLLRALELIRERGFLHHDTIYAVANLCVERQSDVISMGVRYVYHWFLRNAGWVPDIHVFGMKLSALRRVKSMILSFDSLAWTKPVNAKLWHRSNWSAKNTTERELFFCVYVYRLWKVHGVAIPLYTLRWCEENTPVKQYL